MVNVSNSTFFNLFAEEGAAIYLQNLRDGGSSIASNLFEYNRAVKMGGAIVLDTPAVIDISNNNFIRNTVSS